MQEIDKQALKNELQMKRARSLLLDEYMQTKAVHSNINKQGNIRLITNQMLQQSQYLPNYLKTRKCSTVVSSTGDYQEHLGMFFNVLMIKN